MPSQNAKNPFQKSLDEIDALAAELAVLRIEGDNERIREALRLEFLWESNRIEGNTLTLRETQLVIEKGLTVGGKSLREHLEAINHREAIALVEDIVARKIGLSERVLQQIHALVLHGIDRENAGVYRRVPVMIAGSSHVPPQPFLLGKLMEDLFLFYEKAKNELHPVLLAAEMHERFVWIHPFIDGNGRTARLLMNLILMQNGLPICILGGDLESRLRYYDALEKAPTDDRNLFIELIIERVLEALKKYVALLRS